ncbi:hypothetical protein SAMN05216312_10924 [Cohnella sp. OV330]|uniref:hypothetical protein n=1 Tax=Cohnella sp. OV330 TaxID=1855288 RepID=UPI0008ED4D19|nr:hypothetical protein [Cohnella sp. OV330]SFB46566.1 hypothetical protein SAMN05216312_10924 [Cohnella sp. OV330]
MTIPDQPSALSKEELDGLLGADRRHAKDAQDSQGSAMATTPNAPKTSSTEAAAAAAEDAEPETRADDLQMVLGHWERTVAGLQQELIELRSRVARLEQQLGEAPARPASPPAAGSAGHAGRIAASKTPATSDAHAEDEPSTLSRVRTYRSKRGWF